MDSPFALVQHLEDLVALAGDLGDRRADGVGAVAVLDMDHLGHARQLVRDQERAAADGDQRHVAGLGLHAVDRLLGHARGLVEHLLAGRRVEMRDLLPVAERQHGRRRRRCRSW